VSVEEVLGAAEKVTEKGTEQTHRLNLNRNHNPDRN